MKPDWIVVANASLVRFFKRDSPTDPLVALPTMEHPESRLMGHDLSADRSGREATDNSYGGNRFEPRSDPRRKEHRRFAREIAARLDDALAQDAFKSLVICASDPFLGELQAALSEAVRQRLQCTVDRDFTSFGVSELEQRLHDSLQKA